MLPSGCCGAAPLHFTHTCLGLSADKYNRFLRLTADSDNLIARITEFIAKSSAGLVDRIGCGVSSRCHLCQRRIFYISRVRAILIISALNARRNSFHEVADDEPDAPTRIAAQSIIDATARMQAAEHEAVRLAQLLDHTTEVPTRFLC